MVPSEGMEGPAPAGCESRPATAVARLRRPSLIRKWITSEEHKWVTSGERRSRALDFLPDVVFLDLQMPEIDAKSPGPCGGTTGSKERS